MQRTLWKLFLSIICQDLFHWLYHGSPLCEASPESEARVWRSGLTKRITCTVQVAYISEQHCTSEIARKKACEELRGRNKVDSSNNPTTHMNVDSNKCTFPTNASTEEHRPKHTWTRMFLHIFSHRLYPHLHLYFFPRTIYNPMCFRFQDRLLIETKITFVTRRGPNTYTYWCLHHVKESTLCTSDTVPYLQLIHLGQFHGTGIFAFVKANSGCILGLTTCRSDSIIHTICYWYLRLCIFAVDWCNGSY